MARGVKLVNSLDAGLFIPNLYLEDALKDCGACALINAGPVVGALDDDAADPNDLIEDSRGGIELNYADGLDKAVAYHGYAMSRRYRYISWKFRWNTMVQNGDETDFIIRWMGLGATDATQGCYAAFKIPQTDEVGYSAGDVYFGFYDGAAYQWASKVNIGNAPYNSPSTIWTLEVDTTATTRARLIVNNNVVVGWANITNGASANNARFLQFGGFEAQGPIEGKGTLTCSGGVSWHSVHDSDGAGDTLEPTTAIIQARYPMGDESNPGGWTGTGHKTCGLYSALDDAEDAFNVQPDLITAPGSGANKDIFFDVMDLDPDSVSPALTPLGVAVTIVADIELTAGNSNELSALVKYDDGGGDDVVSHTLYRCTNDGANVGTYYAFIPDAAGTPFTEAVFNASHFGVRALTAASQKVYSIIIHVLCEDATFARVSALECAAAGRRRLAVQI